MTNFALSLRRFRAIREVKQSHVAELLGVTQSTVSRWERQELIPTAAQARHCLEVLHKTSPPDGDSSLKRLIRSSNLPCHLISDLTHCLMAASAPRIAEWGRSELELRGQSLWEFATDDIRAAEAQLDDVGWYDGVTLSVLTYTRANGGNGIRIGNGFILWEQVFLSDGSRGRIVTSGPREQLIEDAPNLIVLP
jgi:transcriptional regulator with XRE-family HTH domain